MFTRKYVYLIALFLLTLPLSLSAQSKIENLIIVTCDGLRWQDVFTGMDSAIANNKKFFQGDSAGIFKAYWNDDVKERRKKLFPFLWTTIAKEGQIYGNRALGTRVDNANPYWFSYPGYSEIFCGFVDTAINSNEYKPNPNTNLLEYLNGQSQFGGRVAAFCAWDAFDRILNEPRSKFPVVSAFDDCGGSTPNSNEQLLNKLRKDSFKPWDSEECFDVFTHYEAMEYLTIHHPKVMYIAYGETDEDAHSGHYKDYLNAAHQDDAWLKQIWEYVQGDANYRNKTALFVTVDHGRGGKQKEKWTSHGQSIEDAHEIWFAVIGPGIPAKGEIQGELQLFQKQFAQTMASLLGVTFTAEHPVGEKIPQVFK
ncbi:MAG TPA: phosphoglyceromutase [Bacteroidota bacterium]|nr:phosphoglyceromutase [Bacteroidota bacterium]